MDKSLLDSFGEYVHLLLDVICAVDEDSRIIYVSDGATRVFGYSPQEMIGKRMLDLLHPEDRAKTRQSIESVMRDKQVLDFENRYIRKDGQIVHLLWSTTWSEKHKMRFGVARDITRIKTAEAMQNSLIAISDTAHRTQGIKQICQQILIHLDSHLAIATFGVAINQAKTERWKIIFESVGGCIGLLSEDMMRQVAVANEITLKSTEQKLMLLVPLVFDDECLGIMVFSLMDQDFLLNENIRALLGFTALQMATAIKRYQSLERLQNMALYDTLTGLPNRELFHDRVQLSLLRAKRENTQFSLIYLDLDKFKQANDTFGHSAGDCLLKEVAQRISTCIRETDTVARFGGDEFVILLDSVDNRQTALNVAEKIRLTLCELYEWQGYPIELSASIGISVFPEQGELIPQLLAAADEAMYKAKKRGKNGIC